MSTHEVDFDYAAAMSKQASALMTQHRVPPTPENYSIWYNYAVGTAPELKRAINNLISCNTKFDSATSRTLVSTYLGAPTNDGTATDVSQRLTSVMMDAKRFVTTAISDNRDQIRAISGVAEQAESGTDPRVLVANLMAELATAATRASKLESNFNESSRELDRIRESLDRAEQLASTDSLTGLPNRRALNDFLEATRNRALKNNAPLSILMIDVDHFKQFNDNFGHRVGDQVLRLIANALKDLLREDDLPARFGGEEFIAVLPGADLAICQIVADRVRKGIAACKIKRRSTGEVLPGITVSIGAAEYRRGEETAGLIERCDAALYQAKRKGRNRIAVETEVGEMAAAG